jgi:hypothetical protein
MSRRPIRECIHQPDRHASAGCGQLRHAYARLQAGHAAHTGMVGAPKARGASTPPAGGWRRVLAAARPHTGKANPKSMVESNYTSPGNGDSSLIPAATQFESDHDAAGPMITLIGTFSASNAC